MSGFDLESTIKKSKKKAEKAAADCLIARRELWDGIYETINNSNVELKNGPQETQPA